MALPTPKLNLKEVNCVLPISIKEENGEFYSEGFICTTHPDRARDNEVEGEILTKQACEQIKDLINQGVATTLHIGSTRAVSNQHDYIKEQNFDLPPAGVAIPPAEVRETGDNHYGVWVKTHHNKLHPQFEDIKYKVSHGYIPGYSIEYYPGESFVANISGRAYRVVKTVTDFIGYGFASLRKIANPNALITGFGYKEVELAQPIPMEVKMAEEPVKIEEPKFEVKEAEQPKTEVKVDIKELVESIRESPEYKEAIDLIKVQNKVLKTGTEDKMQISIKEVDDSLRRGETVKLKEVIAEYMDDEEAFNKMFIKEMTDASNISRGFKSNLKYKCVGKGIQISGLKVKGTLDTTSNTSSYTQAPVEFADLFAPGIIDTFNNQTNFFGFLRKEQHPGGTHYQWKMVTNQDPGSNNSFVDVDDTSVLKNFANKLNYQTPLKIARRGISVTDFINRYSARSLGDLFQLEVNLQMNKMMTDVDAALFAEVADGTGNSPLGLEAVADSAGNTTLYGYTRSTANRLSPAAVTDTYIASVTTLTEAVLRNGCTKLEVAGTRSENIAIVAHPLTRDMIFNLLDGQRQFLRTEAQFGFNKKMVAVFDGYPIIVDHNCTSDSIFIIDTEADVIVVGQAPQMTGLAKVGAATEAYLQFDFAHVYKEPRKIHMLNGCTGP